jgi:tRNA(Ile)-lysidine synthase
MLERVLSVLKERCGLEPPALILVGVSGGPDSTCLMHLLHAVGFGLIAAHLDHGLRPESAVEAAAVEELAASLQAPFVLKRVDVRVEADSAHESIEEAGRRVRYEFLFDEARRHGAAVVVTGHTADDQVETILMHLIRGAGLSGLKGMEHRTVMTQFDASIPLVRPLLHEWRGDTVVYCRTNLLSPHHDPSNDSLDFFRNRIRRELIPALESYNPRVRQAILRTAQTLAADHSIVDAYLTKVWSALVMHEADGLIEFDAAGLAAQPKAVRRRIILRAVQQLAPGLDIGYATLGDAAAFLEGAGSAQMQLGGGVTMTRDPRAVHVSLYPGPVPTADWPQLSEQSADVPQGSPLSMPLADGWHFSVEYQPVSASALELIPREGDAFQACLDADSLPGGLELRWPRRGDRFQPLGLGGHSQLLSDSFVNAKVPLRARGHWPLLCSGNRLVWVPGYRPDEAFKLTAKTRRAVRFEVSRLVDQEG